MGTVSTNLVVNAGDAIGPVQDLLGVVRELAAEWDSAMESMSRTPAISGPGEIAAQWTGAADAVEAAAGRIDASLKGVAEQAAGIADSLKGIGDISSSGLGGAAAGLDKLATGLDAAKTGAAGLAEETKGLGEGLDSVKAGSDGAAEGLKGYEATAAKTRDTTAGLTEGLGTNADALKVQRDFMASYTAEMDAMAATMARTADVSAGASLSMGKADGIIAAQSATKDLTAAQVAAGAEARNTAEANEAASASAAESAGKWHMAILGGAAVLGYGVDLAAKLQTGTNRLYTSAGESQANLPMISKGILALSGQTDTSQANLMTGAYWDESAGFHGKDALAVLKSGAQGAYMEGADIGTTENALTTELNDYFGGPQKSAAKQQQQANAAMNAIITSVGLGKMTLQGISSAMPVLLPTAHAAGLTLPQILGAESTMTSQGMSAQDSAQDIKYAITHTQKPSNVQTAEMQMLGINPLQVESSLGKQGLTGLIKEYDSAISSHTNKSGQVQLDVMNQSKLAMDSARAAITKLPESVQGVAREYLSGKLGQAQWYELTSPSKSTLPALEVARLKQFGTVADSALGFSSMIKSGQGDKQTATAALNELMGGAPGQTVGQYLGGTQNLKTFNDDVATVGQSVSHTGANVKGWDAAQQSLNFKLGSFADTLKAVDTEAGQVALPALTKVLGGADWLLGEAATHPAITKDAMIGGGILALPAILSKVSSAGTTLAASAGKVGQILGVPGADKLAALGKGGGGAGTIAGAAEASDGLTGVAGASGEAASALRGVAGAAGKITTEEEITGGHEPPVVPVSRTGTTEETAAEDTEADTAKGVGGGIALGNLGGALTSGAMVAAAADGAFRFLADRLPAPSPSAVKSLNDHGSFVREGTEDLLGKRGAPRAISAVDTLQHYLPARHGTAVGFDDTRHFLASQGDTVAAGAKNTADWVTSGFDGNRHAAASIGDAVASFFGFGGSSHPAPPSPQPVSAAQAAGEQAIAPPRALPASTSAALAKSAAADVKLHVSIDDAALGAAKAHITSMLTALSGGSVKPVKIPAPDLSAVEQAKSKVSADMGAITGAMSAGAGAAAAAGSAVSSGFAGGIAAGEGAAVAAARQVASAAAAAMATQVQAKSPSRVTMKTGKDTADGFAEGLTSGTSDVTAAAKKVSDAATETLKKATAAKVTISASTATSLITGLQGGQDAITAAQSLAKGITAPFKDSTIADTAAKLQTDITNALKDHQITAAEASGMKDYVNAETAQLQKLAGQRAQLSAQIQQANSFGQQTAASANQGANIMTIAGNIQSADTSTSAPTPAPQYQASDLVSGMQAQVTATRQFTADLGKLKKEGLNKAEIQQIASAGAQAGDPVAQAILQGGPGSVKQLNQLASEMNKAAQALGKTAENAVYDPGKDKAQLKGVDASMKGIATQEINSLKTALSSSAAAADFAGTGASIAGKISNAIESAFSAPSMAGLVAAIEAALEGVAKADSKGGGSGGGGKSKTPPHHAPPQSDASSHPAMAAAGAAPGGSAGGGYAGPSGGGGDTHLHTHVHAGAVISEGDLMRTVRAAALNNASNNAQGGWQFPGRRV